MNRPLTGAALAARRRKLEADEAKQPIRLWWLSFAEPGQGNLGIAIVEARGLLDATDRCWRLKINPGGEVAAMMLPDEARPIVAPFMDKLTQFAELHAAGIC